MFIVTAKDGSVEKYRSLSNKKFNGVTIECTTDAEVNNAILEECKIHSKYDIRFKHCYLSECRFNDVTIHLIETLSFDTYYDNVTFRYVHHSSISGGRIYNSVLREIRAHFIAVGFGKIALLGLCYNIYLSKCRGMVSASGLGDSIRTAYCYDSPDGPIIALGCFRGTRTQAACVIAAKYGDSPGGKLYLTAVETLFGLLESQ